MDSIESLSLAGVRIRRRRGESNSISFRPHRGWRVVVGVCLMILMSGRSVVVGEDATPAKDEGANDRRPPNILWICTDQQRWDTIHALGNPHIKTPNLDRLVREGVSFTHAHCAAPICTASRAAMLTGMYPSAVHGCKNGAAYWPEAAPLVTKLLRDSGYVCGLSGKLHLSTAMANNPERRPRDDGYSEFHYSHSPSQGGDANEYLQWLASKEITYKQVKRLPWDEQVSLNQTTWCCDRAIDFLKNHAERPWLFSVNIFDPHPPLDPPPDFAKRFNIDAFPGPLWRESDLPQKSVFDPVMFQSKPKPIDSHEAKIIQAKYWAMVEIIDENIGRLMDALDETGQRGNTVIVFTSDHGNMTGDHGLRAKGCRFYEGLVRVPLIFWAPGLFRSGLRSDALVELTDIAPTLMDFTAGGIPKHMQGKSLRPILTGQSDPSAHREAVRCEFYSCIGPGPGSEHWPDSYASMLRTRKYKVCVYHGFDSGELFDLEKDPGEFENLWDDPDCHPLRNQMVRECFEQTVAANLPNMPIMTNADVVRKKMDADPHVRFSNRLEDGVWISSFEDTDHRIVVRHDTERCGWLYDLKSEKPARDRWNGAECRETRFRLLKQCFDAFVFSIDPGPERIGRY